jgi:hypothetical protein
MTLDDFFSSRELSRRLFDRVHEMILAIGPIVFKVSKSQVAFKRGKTVAVVWMPGQYLRGNTAPLVLTFSFSRPHPSTRWKEVVEVSPSRCTHHLELWSAEDIDDEVRDWLKLAYSAAGPRP